MDDFIDVLIVALYNMAVVQWLDKELQLLGFALSVIYVTYRIITGIRQDRRDKSRRKEEEARRKEEKAKRKEEEARRQEEKAKRKEEEAKRQEEHEEHQLRMKLLRKQLAEDDPPPQKKSKR